VFLLLPILIKRVPNFLEEEVPLLEISTIIAEKEERHVEEGCILFHK
jgi:hypothetical protein